MGNVTIPQLPAVTGLTGNELVVLAQLGVMKSASISEILGLTPTTVQGLSPTAASVIIPSAPSTIVVPKVTGAITLTINPGTTLGQRVLVYGGAYAITVQSNVSSDSPEFIYTDGSTGYSWTIPASAYTQYISMIWDGGNWRCTTSGQTIVAAATQSNAALQLGQVNASVLSILNATGAAPVYACRAWVLFDSTGAVKASGNVSSVTKNSTGDYTVNFITALPDANYSTVSNNYRIEGTGMYFAARNNLAAQTAGSCRVASIDYQGSFHDIAENHYAFFR
jgi:hypothetical protein